MNDKAYRIASVDSAPAMTSAARPGGGAREVSREPAAATRSTNPIGAGRQILLATCLLIAVSIPSPARASSGDEADVRSVWESYRAAILARDAASAYALVDQTTRGYYRELLQVVLYAKPADMPELMIMVKLAVVQSRREIPPAVLLGFDGEGYFKYSVERGWFSRESMQSLRLAAIEIDGDRAQSKVESDGELVTAGFEFNRENGAWRVNLMPAVIAGEWALQQVVRASGKAEDDFIFDLVEAHSGTRPDASIWEPIVNR